MFRRAIDPNLFTAGAWQYSITFARDVNGILLQEHRTSLPDSLGRATPKRQNQFLAGRHCAIQALKLAGVEASDLPIGTDRGPVWPEGWVGSITHSGEFASAVVGRADQWTGLGLDTEHLLSTETAEAVRSRVLTGAESRFAGDLSRLTLIFSAKECLYKCLRHQVGRFFGFAAAEIVEIGDSSWVAELREDLGLRITRLEGRYAIDGDLVHTGISLSSRS